MKQIFLALLTLISLPTSAQPKIVGTLANNGSKYGGSIFRLDLPGSSPGVVYAFDNRSPHAPVGGIIAGDADWLYGSLTINGTNNNGAFYKIRRNGLDFTKLFDYNNSSASTPFYHTDNYIYVMGGNELKKIDPVTNTVVNLVNNVYGLNLHIDAGDWIYFLGASSLNKIKTNGSMQTLLHNFSFPSDGYNPVGVTEVPGDSLFGIQSNGGATDGGTMFSIRKDGSNFVVRHQFTNATGMFPNSNLVYFNGKLFGYTTQGGNFGNGTLYSINTDGSGFNVIYHFPSANGSAFPAGNISISSNGRIFGAFSQYFQTGFNAYKLYKIDTSGENFEPICTLDNRESGNFEQGLLLLNDKDIYFTALQKGKYDGGVLAYCDSNGVGNSLYHFGYSISGFQPNGGVIKASDGKLYGTAVIGGISGNGVVFSLNNDGTGYTKLHEFTAAEGYEPSGKLLEASDGKLYGACKFGVANLGMIYRLDKSGSNFQVIFEFTGVTEGFSPVGSLVEDANGFLYGTNFYNVLGGGGSVFKMNKNGGGYITLKEFSLTPGLKNPYNGVTLSKSYLYGACGYGGVENKGGLYRIKTDGSGYQLLHEFTVASGGELPVATPCIASNGKLYGSTSNGGTNNEGILYRIDSTGTNFTVLRNFSSVTDGSFPWGGMIQASDGILYGSTQTGGNNNSGTVFSCTLNGSGFTVVKHFDLETEGQGLMSSLIDLNGNFALPVQWMRFTVEKKNQAALLNWQTAAEQNNNRFEIERSSNGIQFITIGIVKSVSNLFGAGYSFEDTRPLTGINFYRLKQVDVDGKFNYSHIVQLNFQINSTIKFFPNPAKNTLYINVPFPEKIHSVTILNFAGRIVQRSVNQNSSSLSLPIQQLEAGTYGIYLKTSKGTYNLKFIKQ